MTDLNKHKEPPLAETPEEIRNRIDADQDLELKKDDEGRWFIAGHGQCREVE